MRIKVSGRTYYACLDPNATGVPNEIGLPEPWSRRHGKGEQFIYELVPAPVVALLLEHLETMAECFLQGDDADTRVEGRAIRDDLRRLKRQLGMQS